MAQLPKYPNWSSILGSTAPIVTTLLATISTAILLSNLQSNFTSRDVILGPPTWGSSEAVLVLGAISTAIFVAMTFSLAYAQACNFDTMTSEIQEAIFADGNVKNENDKKLYRDGCRQRTLQWMGWIYLLAWAGLATLALAIAGLAFGHVLWMSSAFAFVAAVVSVILFLPGSITPRILLFVRRIVATLLVAASTVLFVGTVVDWQVATSI